MTAARGLRFAFILLALLVGSTCAACAPTTLPSTASLIGPTPTVTVPFELPVTITLTGRFPPETLAVLDQQIAAFEEANPDIRVAIADALGNEARRHEQFTSQLGTGDTSNDVYVLDPAWLAEFGASGWLTPLDEFAAQQGIELAGFLPSTAQAAVVDGRLVALPWLADGGMLYYRRDLLEKYGFDPPTTWEDLNRVALEVKGSEGLPYGLIWQGAAYEGLTCNTLESVWAYGGDVLDENGQPVFDSAGTRMALGQMTDRIASGASPPEVATSEERATLTAFQQGDAVFMRNWAYAWDRLNAADSPLAGQIGLAPLPASCLGGQHLALSVHSQHPEQALRLMAFLVGHEQQLQMARQGIQPPAMEAAFSDGQVLAERPFLRDMYAALSVTRPRPQSPSYRDIAEAIYTEVSKMLLGKQNAQTTASEVQDRLEAIVP
jgi:multiple sugar transport system substrate-binding protein